MRQDTRLAGAGAGEDEQRPVDVGDRLALLLVEPGEQGVVRGRTGVVGAVCIARGLAPGGRLICCELDPERAAHASRSLAQAGVDDRAEVRVGPALETLRAMPKEPTLDLVFVDADKESYGDYYEEAMPRLRIGGLLVASGIALNTIFYVLTALAVLGALLTLVVPTAELPHWLEREHARWTQLARDAKLSVD